MGLDSLQCHRHKAKFKVVVYISLVRGTHTNFIVRFGIFNNIEVTRRNLGVRYNRVDDIF